MACTRILCEGPVCFLGLQLSLVFLQSAQINVSSVVKTHFKEVVVFPASFTAQDLAAVANWIQLQQFDAVFYPSVGMHSADVLLANLRLSGVQVTSYGHSASTHGSKIDYFLASAEVEMVRVFPQMMSRCYVNSFKLLPRS